MKKSNTLKPLLRLIKLCWKKQKILTFLIFFLSVTQSLFPVITAYALQNVINLINFNDNNNNNFAIVLYCSAIIISQVISIITTYINNIFSIKIVKDINFMIMSVSMQLELTDFENSSIYDILTRALNETQRPIESFFTIIYFFGSIATFLSYAAVLATWKWYTLFFIIVIPIISLVFTTKIGKYEYDVMQHRTPEQRKVNYISSILNNANTFKENQMLNIRDYILNKYTKSYEEFAQKDIEIVRTKSKNQGVFKILEAICGILIIVLIINNAYVGAINIGKVYILITAIWGVISSADNIASYISSLFKNGLFIKNLFEFLDIKPGFKDKKNKEIKINKIKSIEFKSVSFKYKEDLPYAIKNVSFLISTNQKVAIIGENGSGKSTIIKLLSGLYTHYEGEILINGTSLADLDLDSYQKQIGIVFQDFSKYEFTLEENLRLGNRNIKNDAFDKRLSELTSHGLLTYIVRLKNGMKTQLGHLFNNGIQLSGGEWQQLAIGRMLMKDASFYILDEPCSNLDLRAERSIYQFLSKLAHQKICVLVSHRLHNILYFADSILLFENGQLLENDSVSALINNSDSIFRNEFFNIETQEYFNEEGQVC